MMGDGEMRLSISRREILDRQSRFYSKLQVNQIDCAIMFSVTDIFYLTGFHFHPTERPIGFFIDSSQRTHLFVPALEHEHAEAYAEVDHVHSYPEYPGARHPMEYLKDALIEVGFNHQTVGFDTDGYGSPYGYRGPRISELLDAKSFKSINGLVREMRFIKSPAEIELIKESCRWGNLAHRLLVKYSEEGLSEIEIANRATTEATLVMIETLGSDYKPHGSPARAFYRGQIGKFSAFPHAVTQNIVLRRGDTLISQAHADVWGYKSELERTMFLYETNREQEKYFNFMLEAQEVAFNTIKPGIPASAVEEAVQTYFKEQGILHLTRHHTGHSIGLLGHEGPFFDLGDDTILQPGMVLTVEPGLYVKGLGGFRHSDTILVTEDGLEKLTYYPRDLNSLIV